MSDLQENSVPLRGGGSLQTEIQPARLAAAPCPSPLLRLLAGEAAGAVARLWPPPHADYIAAPASRRHLLGIVLATTAELTEAAAGWFGGPLARAIPALLPGAPPGVRWALERMGETGWPLQSYRNLLALLGRPEAAKALRHATALDCVGVDTLAAMPEALLDAGVGLLRLSPGDAAMAREGFLALVRREGGERAEAAAHKWGRARTSGALFQRMHEDLLAEPMPAPFPPTPHLRWLASKAEVRDAARRHGNCLALHLQDAASGREVFGEWLVPPGAIVRLSRDPVSGWRLAEARGPKNGALSASARTGLRADLGDLGVSVGCSGDRPLCALNQAGQNDPTAELCLDELDDPFGRAVWDRPELPPLSAAGSSHPLFPLAATSAER